MENKLNENAKRKNEKENIYYVRMQKNEIMFISIKKRIQIHKNHQR